MPHVSKKKLDVKIFDKLFKQFVDISAHLDTRATENLYDEILTTTEKVMLTKRLAAVVMLSEGYSEYAVWNTLKLSSSTVAKLHLAYQNGQYRSLIDLFRKKKKKREQFWVTLEVLLRGGMPSMGKDRWKHLP